MKRKYILQKLRELNYQFEEGSRHTKVLKNGKLITEVPRHTEIGEILAKKIFKDANIK